MSLSYLRDDCHKQAVTHIRESRRFKSMYTLQGKTRPTWYVRFPRQSTYAQRLLPAGSPHTWQLFVKSSTAMDRTTALEKKGSRHNPQRVGWSIHESIPSFSPEPAIEAVGVKPPSIGNQLLGLPGPYHRHAIGTFNTCSWGPTHRSLIDTGGATTLEVPACHIPLHDLPNKLSPVFPNCPARSPV
jgi:hypothetical protein